MEPKKESFIRRILNNKKVLIIILIVLILLLLSSLEFKSPVKNIVEPVQLGGVIESVKEEVVKTSKNIVNNSFDSDFISKLNSSIELISKIK